MNPRDADRLLAVIFPDKIKQCWGCGEEYFSNWSSYDLSTINSFVTGNKDVLVCPDCREEIESIEKESKENGN